MRLVADEEHHEVVIGAVRRAKRRVWIATANVKEMLVAGDRAGRRSGKWHSILAELDRLARDGVELRLLHAALPSRPFRDTFDRFERLCAGGLQLRMCPRVHLKTVIVDDRSMYLGSANFTGAGLGAKGPTRRNFELGVMTEDPAFIEPVRAIHERIWSGAACAGCGRRDTCEAPLDLPERRPGSNARVARTIVRLRPPSGSAGL